MGPSSVVPSGDEPHGFARIAPLTPMRALVLAALLLAASAPAGHSAASCESSQATPTTSGSYVYTLSSRCTYSEGTDVHDRRVERVAYYANDSTQRDGVRLVLDLVLESHQVRHADGSEDEWQRVTLGVEGHRFAPAYLWREDAAQAESCKAEVEATRPGGTGAKASRDLPTCAEMDVLLG